VRTAIVAAATAVALLLAGCSTAENLADQYADGSGQGYISGDGAYTEIPPAERDDPVVFAGTDERGQTIDSESLAGEVYVVNFWYASCPPCRVEAPDLAAVSADYPDVPFIGVNIADSADVALTFATKFGVPYPSILDAETAAVQLAFAGSVAPNAVPTTVVVDREGRVAARISGLLRDPSILAAMIDTVVAEDS
jgi:thiol-disulfide isomerase/thioredoxin